MRQRSLSILLMLCLAAIPAIAQTRPFNAAGVTAGHEHLAGTDAAAHNAFWTALGAVPAQLGTNQILKIPGVFIMFQNAGARGGRGLRLLLPALPRPLHLPHRALQRDRALNISHSK